MGAPGFAGNSCREQGAGVGFVRAAAPGIGCQWRAAHVIIHTAHGVTHQYRTGAGIIPSEMNPCE